MKEVMLNNSLLSPPQLMLTNQSKKCCLWEECTNCNNLLQRYPIIFLHGHAVNKDVSADYSLDAFNQIQTKLEEERYVSAGSSAVYDHSNPKQMWIDVPAPITLKVSYYYDFLLESDKASIVQTKSESIDAYAVKIKEAIDWVKWRTNQPKVIIIAHSMGGLVARRYAQIFGPENVDKIILIGTPNKGVVGNVANWCSLIGEELECRDLQQGSLFLNKLNKEKDKVSIFTINGKGCDMKGIDSDGVVIVDNSVLEGINNTWIEGNCAGTDTLHTEMLNIKKYPEVYDKIVEILEN